jgi:hypothetical protein
MRCLLTISLFFILLLTESCRIDQDFVEPPYDSKMVVNGLLNNEDPIQLSVSFSVGSLSPNQPGYLDDARVEVWEDGISLGLGTYNFFDKAYAWSQIPKAGSLYRVRVEHPRYPVVDETLLMPGSSGILSLQYIDSVGLDSSGDALAALIATINDPAGEKNFYRLYFAYYNEVVQGFLPFAFSTNDDVLLSPATEKTGDGSYLFNDNLFNGKSRQIRIEFSRGIATGTPRFLSIAESLSSDLYSYELSVSRFEASKDNPFAEPVFIYSNIRGGLGIWAGKTTAKDTIY